MPDLKLKNENFNSKERKLRNKFFGQAINGLLASGQYDREPDKLIEEAFEIAVKAVDKIDYYNPGENHKALLADEKANFTLSSSVESKLDPGTITS